MEFVNDFLRLSNIADSRTLQSVSQTAANVLISTIWQSMLLVVGLGVALRLAPRSTAKLRFSLWAAAFGAILCLPFLPTISQVLVNATSNSASSATPLAMAASTPWLTLDIRWSLLIAAVWAISSFYRAADLTRHALRLRKIWKSAKPVELSTSTDRPEWFSRRTAQLCVTDQLEKPSVIGFLSPRILIPTWLCGRLTPHELDQIILHESEHLARFDDWTNLLQKLSLIVFPLNPILLWIDRQLGREREMACDDGVVQRTQAPRAYATCLANLAERNLQHRSESLSLGAWDRRSELARRVHRILLGKPTLSPAAASTILAALTASLIFGSFELSRCPQFVAFVPTVTPADRGPLASLDSPIVGGRALRTSYSGQARAEQLPTNVKLSPTYLNRSQRVNVKAAFPLPEARMSLSVERSISFITKNADLKAKSPNNKPFIAENLVASQSEPDLQQLSASAQARPAAEQSGEQWLVLTTWQQTVADNSSLSSMKPVEVPGSTQPFDSTRSGTNEEFGNPTYQTTVTRMVFRIVPASYIQSETNPPSHDSPSSNSLKSAQQVSPMRPDQNNLNSLIQRRQIAPVQAGWFFLTL